MVTSTSIIIPTYNRAEDLRACLDSILVQTVMPEEIIIVDDSEDDNTFRLVEERKKEFEEKGVVLKYIKNHHERSSAIARNLGIEAAQGGIIFFLDDDVILMNDYLEHVLEVYQNYPDCVGVQGYVILKNGFGRFDNIVSKIIFHNYIETDSAHVLPSVNVTYPYPLNEISKCEWLAGCNQSYRAEVLREFRFDENFKRYSWREDVDLSYRIYKRYKGLYITPHARLIHNLSPRARTPNRALIYMIEVHQLYLFFKLIDQTPKNLFIYLWNKIGFFLAVLGLLIFKPWKSTRTKLLRLKYLIGAYFLCLTHIKEIRRGDLGFMDQLLQTKV